MFMFTYNYSNCGSTILTIIMLLTIIFGVVMLGGIAIQEIKDFFKNRIDKRK